MRKQKFLKYLAKTSIAYVMVASIFVNFPLQALADTILTVNVLANGQSNLVLSAPTDSFTVTLDTQNAISCQQTSPRNSGIANMASMNIDPTHPDYPAVGGSTVFTVTCDDGTGQSVSSSATVSLPAASLPQLAVDIKANGSDGPVVLNAGETYSYSWMSDNATSCQQTTPTNSGISFAGNSDVIAAGNPLYPVAGSSVTITITCDNGVTSVTDLVVISLAPTSGGSGNPTIDVKANGSDGPVTLNPGDTYTYSWNSANVTSCEQTLPINSGISFNGVSGIIASDDTTYYPTVSSSVTIKVECSDGTSVVSDSVVINLASSGTPTLPTIDVKANGSDGPVTLNPGEIYTYSWDSTNATSCEQTSPYNSGISLNGVSDAITPDNTAYYPTTTTPVTITVTCSKGGISAVDSVVIKLASNPIPTLPTVDVKANGSDGPVALNDGDTYIYTWTSTNATSCQQMTPANSGAALNGTSGVITPANTVYYPTASSSVTITYECDDGVHVVIDSVTITLNPSVIIPPPPVVTVDIKANGSDGPVTLAPNAPYIYTWTSTNATSCELTSPVTQPVSINGTSTSITPGNTTFYPSTTTPTVLIIVCNHLGLATSTDNVVVGVAGGTTCTPASINSPLTASNTVGDFFSYTVTSTTGTTTTVFSIGTSTLPLPPGLSFDPSTQMITGTTTQTGNFNIELVATPTNCREDRQTLVLTVNPVPVVTPPGGGGGGTNPPSGGGGGGSSSGGGHRHPPTDLSCDYLHDYMRIDFQNDPAEVTKLQTFLKDIMGYTNVTVNGVFDQATFVAVSAFQNTYKDEILTPWGHTAPTGYVYILTLKKINEIYCKHTTNLTDAEVQEIIAFRALINGLRNQGINVETTVTTPGGVIEIPNTGDGTTTLPIVGQISPQGQNIRNLAAAIFATPVGFEAMARCLYEWILILIVLYILGSVLKDVLYKDLPENTKKRFLTKWITISVGLALAILIAYILAEWCIIVPLFISLMISLVWMAMFPKHTTVAKEKFKTSYVALNTKYHAFYGKVKNSVIKEKGSPLQ